jgi:hypothetical protein
MRYYLHFNFNYYYFRPQIHFINFEPHYFNLNFFNLHHSTLQDIKINYN